MSNPSQQVVNKERFFFEPDYLESNFLLLALPKELASNVESLEGLCFRGEEGDFGTLCTMDTTYEVKAAETSNALLLTSEEKEEAGVKVKPVVTIPKWYLELKKTTPRLERLHLLLNEKPYKGPDMETVRSGRTFTFDNLLELVQASQKELREGLAKRQATLIDGYWRVVEDDYQDKVMDFILSTITANDWPMDRVPLLACSQELESIDVPPVIVLHCLESYGQEIKENDDDDDAKMTMDCEERYFSLSPEKVSIFRGLQILRVGESQRMELSDFMAVWQETLPEGVTADMNMLRGHALIDTTGRCDTVFLYPKEDLPMDPLTCLSHLFKLRPQWLVDDITPYVQDLTVPGQTVAAFLIKYARCSTDPNTGKRMVNSKYDKNQ